MLEQLSSDNIQGFIDAYLITWGISGVQALLVFIVGRWLARKLVGLSGKAMTRSKMDVMLINFVESMLYWVLLLIVVVAALSQLGVDTTSMIALLGAAGLAVGLALKDTMSNFAAGVLLLMFRPFRVGDYITAGGVSGTVEKIHIFTSTVITPDNREIIVPNSAIYGDVITNFSARATRRVDMTFGISYGDDIRKAKDVMMSVITSHEKSLTDPAPLVAVSELADSSVNFTVRVWCKKEDYWSVFFDCQEQVKLALEAAGISIPFPQMDVHMEKVA